MGSSKHEGRLPDVHIFEGKYLGDMGEVPCVLMDVPPPYRDFP
jgi:hypothetical protein